MPDTTPQVSGRLVHLTRPGQLFYMSSRKWGCWDFSLFALLLYQLVKHGLAAQKHHENKYDLLPIVYLIVAVAFMPPSITLLFLVFVLMIEADTHEAENNAFTLDTGKVLPLYVGVLVIMLAFIGISGYAVGRSYAAEVYFKKSVDAFTGNNVKVVYDNMRQAVVTNPYIERFRTNFSQTNLLIANNVASKATPATEGEKTRAVRGR